MTLTTVPQGRATRRIMIAVEASLPHTVATAVNAIWEEVHGYAENSHPQLRAAVTTHIEGIFGVLITCLQENRAPLRTDFSITHDQAFDRVRQGVSLSDFLQAFRIAQVVLWHAVLDAAGNDTQAREAALSMADQVMHVIEVGSTVAAERYLEAQQHQLADLARLRRDLLEDLLAGREVLPGPKSSMLRAAGLEPGKSVMLVAAVPVDTCERSAMLDAGAGIRRALARGTQGLVVPRQDEIIGLVPVDSRGPAQVLDALAGVNADLAEVVRLAIGVSTVHQRFEDIPEAYAEAVLARDRMGNRSGVLALASLSAFDQLILRADATTSRLIRPELREFVEDDLARGRSLAMTLIAYAANDLNAKAAADDLHIHANTAYYRLQRIADRTGCDVRSFSDVLDLLIAIRVLTPDEKWPRQL